SETPAATPTALSLRHAPGPRTRDPELDKSNPRPGRLDTPTVGVCVAGPDPCPRCRAVLQAPANPGQNAVTDLGGWLVLVRLSQSSGTANRRMRGCRRSPRGEPSHQPMMFTARAVTSTMAATETADWSIIMAFAQRVSGVTSLAAKEMALVNDR